jgi:hypothetical protein
VSAKQQSESDESDTRKTRVKPKRDVGRKSYKESDDEANSDDRDFIVDSSDEEDYATDTDESEEEDDLSSSDEDYQEKSKPKKHLKYKKRNESDSSDSERVENLRGNRKPVQSDSESDQDRSYRKETQKNARKPSKKSDSDSSEKVVTPKKQHVKKQELKKSIQYSKSDDESDSKLKTTGLSQSTSSTEVNSDLDFDLSVDNKEPWELPDLFLNKNFYIYGDFKPSEERLYKRIIVAYGGSVHNYLSDAVDFVITDKEWNKDFDKVSACLSPPSHFFSP